MTITNDEIARALILTVFMAEHQRLQVHNVEVEAPLPPQYMPLREGLNQVPQDQKR